MAKRVDRKVKLTNALIVQLEKRAENDPGVPGLYTDTVTPGLGLKVFKSGWMSFVFRYVKPTGGQGLETLGRAGDITLQEARDLAIERRRNLRRHDLDPLVVKKRRRDEKTFAELAEWYLTEVVAKKRSFRDYERRVRCVLVPALGDKLLSEITQEDIEAILAEKSDAPYEANRIFEVIRAMLRKAERKKWLAAGSAATICDIERNAELPRDEVMKHSQRRRIVAAINALDDPVARTALLLLVDLPFRHHEVLRAEWKKVELDGDRPGIAVEALSDYKRSNWQPLLEHHVEALRALPRAEGNPWVFQNQDGTDRRKSIWRQWAKVRKQAGCPDLRIHDLRRTIATELAKLGASELQIQQALADSTTVAARHYVMGISESNRGMLEEISARGRRGGSAGAGEGGREGGEGEQGAGEGA